MANTFKVFTIADVAVDSGTFSTLYTAGTGVNTSTGVQNDGTVLEAYLMYVGCNNYNLHPDTHFNLTMRSEIDFTYPDVIVAYWNGERWTYDNNAGYNKFRSFSFGIIFCSKT